jgi:hypothetical protein
VKNACLSGIGNKCILIHYDFNTMRALRAHYICFSLPAQMEKLRKKSKFMLALEIVIYLAIAVSVALFIIL